MSSPVWCKRPKKMKQCCPASVSSLDDKALNGEKRERKENPLPSHAQATAKC